VVVQPGQIKYIFLSVALFSFFSGKQNLHMKLNNGDRIDCSFSGNSPLGSDESNLI
jgi:hypothetical protein